MQDRDIARLLSGRNEPSVLEKEALFDAVHARVAPRRRWRSVAGSWLLGGVAAVTLAAALLVSRHVALDAIDARDEFSARGHGPRASFELVCSAPEAAGQCGVNERLAFVVHAPAARFFAAFARGPQGEILWYWPSGAGRSVPSEQLAQVDATSVSILLSAQHKPGRYQIYGVFSRRALDRDEIKRALGNDLKGDGSVELVVHELQVVAP